MTAASGNKELNDLWRKAERQGWTVGITPGGHIKWQPPEGDFIISSATPSDSQIIRTIRRDLERAGLNLGNPRKKGTGGRVTPKKKAPPSAAERQTVGNLTKTANRVIASGIRDPKLLTDEEILALIAVSEETPAEVHADLAVMTPTERFQYARSLRELGPDYPINCGGCGFIAQDGTPLTLFKHMESTGHKRPAPEGSIGVLERDMENPPQREKLECPACSEWFWINEPGKLATHMEDAHGKTLCPSCKTYITTPHIASHYDKCDARVSPRRRRGQGRLQVVPDGPPTDVVASGLPVAPETPQKRTLTASAGVKGSDNWNPDPCAGGCGSAVGADRGTSSYCEMCAPIMDELVAEEAAAKTRHPATPKEATVAKKVWPKFPCPICGKKFSNQRGGLTRHIPVCSEKHGGRPVGEIGPPNAEPTVPAAPAAVATLSKPTKITDDDLFALLEIVLDGPVTMTKESFAAINDWMDATRRLLTIKEKS